MGFNSGFKGLIIINYTVRAIVNISLICNNSVHFACFVYFVSSLLIQRPTLFCQSFKFVCMYVRLCIYIYIYMYTWVLYMYTHNEFLKDILNVFVLTIAKSHFLLFILLLIKYCTTTELWCLFLSKILKPASNPVPKMINTTWWLVIIYHGSLSV